MKLSLRSRSNPAEDRMKNAKACFDAGYSRNRERIRRGLCGVNGIVEDAVAANAVEDVADAGESRYDSLFLSAASCASLRSRRPNQTFAF